MLVVSWQRSRTQMQFFFTPISSAVKFRWSIILHVGGASALTRQTREAEISKMWPIMDCSAHNSDSRSRRIPGSERHCSSDCQFAWQHHRPQGTLLHGKAWLPCTLLVGPLKPFPQWPHMDIDGASRGFHTCLPKCCFYKCKRTVWNFLWDWLGISLLWLRETGNPQPS